MSEVGAGSRKRRIEDPGSGVASGADDREISDADVARTIRHALDHFDDDGKFNAALRAFFTSGFALGLFTRGEQVGSTVSNKTDEDCEKGDDDALSAAPTTNDASKKARKKQAGMTAEIVAKKNKAILSHFGFGGLRVEKLIRSLNNAVISQPATMADHLNLHW
jgi:hypothetical protein